MTNFRFSRFMLVAGLLFIYLPMLILVIYSFNASRLVTVWGGWSTKWYAGLLDNTQLMNAVMRSLEIASQFKMGECRLTQCQRASFINCNNLSITQFLQCITTTEQHPHLGRTSCTHHD